MIRTKAEKQHAGVEAFCLTCPAEQEVTHILGGLGVELTFHLPAKSYAPSSQTPPLPAQYHYKDVSGNAVIFPAGKDANQDGERLPPQPSPRRPFQGCSVTAFDHVSNN